ncbi:MAG: hypothetical protein L0387_00610 [Acidobacteria bacterium]|nr:hypothetical protein [Acidobacteriota bacterium]MCI0720316.1 hypothetical protein [Acidobacteriota bacterium]
MIALNRADQEVIEVLGKEATLSEREVYRHGHRLGGSKAPWRPDALPWLVWRF